MKALPRQGYAMPRPRKARSDSRVSRLNLRFTPEESACVIAAAQAVGLTPSAFACRAVLASLGLASLPAQQQSLQLEPVVIAALNRVGANLNQLVRRANSGVMLQPGELPEALASLSVQLARIETLVTPAVLSSS